jgi:hypothetical protein
MLRVSVVREILNSRISACARDTSNPRAIVPPTVVAFKKPRRVSSMRSSFAGALMVVEVFQNFASRLSSEVHAP